MAQAKEEILTTPRELADCCEFLATQPVLGFDTEFVGEETYHPRLCLVQVAVPDRLFLIDPFATGPLDEFWKLLHDPSRVVIVHAGREEVRLCRLWSGRPPANLFDLQLAAGLARRAGRRGALAEAQGCRVARPPQAGRGAGAVPVARAEGGGAEPAGPHGGARRPDHRDRPPQPDPTARPAGGARLGPPRP